VVAHGRTTGTTEQVEQTRAGHDQYQPTATMCAHAPQAEP
jgi:hypothetical protein